MARTSSFYIRCKCCPRYIGFVGLHDLVRLRTRHVKALLNAELLISLFVQIIGVEEDKISKPHRPFLSGRISLKHGERLYLLAIALCIAASAYNGLLHVTFVYMLAIWLYNEGGWSLHPIPKSPLGAIGYMCYCWGTTYIIGKSFVLPLITATLTLCVKAIKSL
jgi:4-hydroxybenzoate polyprenyltransferase